MKEKRAQMSKPLQPLAEVFGHLVDDQSPTGTRYRSKRLCPFNNSVPNCTKDKAKNPLGVCSIFHESTPVVTCPVRFREDWLIMDDAASFFFKENASWSSLTEVRLNDVDGKSAGNIDVVLVAYNEEGKIYDFGALEVQAVYISGNVREPFEYYMKHAKARATMDWSAQPSYPRPDYLSSSRKRLAPQLLFKGGILHSWGRKIAVVLNKSFFQTLPRMKKVSKTKAQIAWLMYDLDLVSDNGHEKFMLKKVDQVYTEFESALLSMTTPAPGNMGNFVKMLQEKLDERLEIPPTTKIIEKPF